MTSLPSIGDMLGSVATGTFLGFSSATLGSINGANIVIMGAPCATPYASVGPYSSNAPAAIRAASSTYNASAGHMNFDLDGPIVPAGVVVVDIGDIEYDAGDGPGNRERLQHAVEQVLAVGAVPIVLGGDDSIPIPVLAAYHNRRRVSIVQIDAHIDWRDEVAGERFGLSSTMRRCSEMPHVGTMIQVGRRGVGSARPSDAADARARGVHFVNAHDVHRFGVDPAVHALPSGSSAFITVDIDGLDPSIVPGVVGPEPGGLTYWQAVELIDGVAARATIAGFDLVEFVPERDINGMGALVCFRIVAHAIGRIARQTSNL